MCAPFPVSPVCQARLPPRMRWACGGSRTAEGRMHRSSSQALDMGVGVAEGGGVGPPHTGKEAANTGPFVLCPGLAPGTQRSRPDDARFAKVRFATNAHGVAAGPGHTRDGPRRVLRRRMTLWSRMGESCCEAPREQPPWGRAASGDVSRLWPGSALEGGHRTLSVSARSAPASVWPGRSPQPRSCLSRGVRCRQGPRHSWSPSCRWPCGGW